MKIHEILERDPRTHALANSGQARITSDKDDRAIAELRAELETFVCDGHYGDAIERILKSYLSNLDRPKQDAAWVSGFFGSGKSHLLKMLGHLWVDTQFDDGATARSLVHGLTEDIKAHLRELDTMVTRSKRSAVAAAGTLPAGSGDFVKMTVLSIILEARGLPQQYAQAKFCFWLQDEGYYENVRKAVEAADKEWLKELNNLYVSNVIARALLDSDPNFAGDEREARQTLRAQFPNKSDDITTDEFLDMTRKALEVDGELPLTILVLDEVQQYIGNSLDRAVAITEVTEALYTQLDSKVMVVASGQSALSGTPLLQKLKDRFRINAPLSDADVETVTRKVLLPKKPSCVSDVKVMLDQNSGEIAKHLDGTRLSTRSEDSKTIVQDYPLLPSRRRFWEECFRAVDAAGTHSQLRSQLRILHDSLIKIADRDIGAVIPADALFNALAPNLVQTGVLLNEIDLRIRQLDDGTEAGKIRKRICGLVFLISKLSRESGSDVGVRATARHIADLLIDDITVDSGPFRKQVERELEHLAKDGTLMKVGNEFRMQTTEGAEWDRAYREKAGALRQRESDISVKREQLFGASVQRVVGEIRLLHGESKERRTLHLYTGVDESVTSSDHIIVWLRDGWSIAQKDIEAEARQLGQEDPILHVFLPRKSADDLTSRIIDLEATRRVIDLKGIPGTNEGSEARKSMQSRHATAQQMLDELIQEIISSARVFQSGGNEIYEESLSKKLETAAKASLARLFPEFSDGDHKAWGVALKRARDGSDEPLRIIGWEKATEDHKVVRRVKSEVGSGAKGNDVRKKLQSSPYGWPRDAIDAALIILHRREIISAYLNGQSIEQGQLDQNKISKTVFKFELDEPLSTEEKIEIRSLFHDAGLSLKSGEEKTKATEYLSELRALAEKAGGEAPLPACPSTTKIDDIARLHGNEQLMAILGAKDELTTSRKSWLKISERMTKRIPQWQQLEQMLPHAEKLLVYDDIFPEMQAIISNRSLLDDTDYVTPLLTKTANALRSALTEKANEYESAFKKGIESLDADSSWKHIDKKEKEAILAQVALTSMSSPVTKTNEDIIQELNRSSLDARNSEIVAISARITKALEKAAKSLNPEAITVNIRAATLEDETAVHAWIEEHRKKLLDAVSKGPVIIG